MKDEAVKSVTVFTIGYGGKSAAEFFGLLRQARVRCLIDVRLYNTSQLAGYAKRDDLAYFTEAIVGAEYIHLPQLAPTKEILDGYKKGVLNWDQYERQFNQLIATRQIEQVIEFGRLEKACFLCAEAKADYCHRRLVVEYLMKQCENLEIIHL